LEVGSKNEAIPRMEFEGGPARFSSLSIGLWNRRRIFAAPSDEHMSFIRQQTLLKFHYTSQVRGFDKVEFACYDEWLTGCRSYEVHCRSLLAIGIPGTNHL
jgi:hypothetical protein